MQKEDEEWIIQAMLRYDRNISHVELLQSNDAVPRGTNYGSDMKRVNLKILYSSGAELNKTVIYKMLPRTEARRAEIEDSCINIRETEIFSKVLPQMEKIRQEKHPGIEPLTPLCFGLKDENEALLLEDLKACGYTIADRRKCLDLEHATLAIKALADFHSSSLILVERGLVKIKDFIWNVYYDNGKEYIDWVDKSLDHIAAVVEDQWKGEWIPYGQRLRDFKVNKHFLECFRYDDKNFNALYHGDPWTTNMMFKYSKDGHPINARLIDFQITSFNNTCLDLQYFFHTSLDLETLRNVDQLLRLYADEVQSRLASYGYEGRIPTYKEICENYERVRVVGLCVGLSFRPTMTMPEKEVPVDLEEWTKSEEFTFPDLNENHIRPVIEYLLKQALENRVL